MEPLKDFEAQHAVGLVVAVVLGALIGLERQLRSHPAGCHTNALVALGAAAYALRCLMQFPG
jgi:putative Mg2+ transporter-C (MgtC) family protein